MKKALIAALAAVWVVGCASADEPKKDAKAACAPAPKELVTKDLKKGDGPLVAFRSAILVSYTGWLYDECAPDHKGAKFDSSEGRATPLGFIVGAGRVIKGWDEGLIGTQENTDRLLIIPPDKGYGASAAPGGKIPPNSTLVFEVTVLKILSGGQPAQNAAPAK